MKAYPQQHEPWRPDYPPVWNMRSGSFIIDFRDKPRNKLTHNINIQAHAKTVWAIVGAMKP